MGQGKGMKTKSNIDDDLRSEYDFDYLKAVRGKHFKRLLEDGATVIVLETDEETNGYGK